MCMRPQPSIRITVQFVLVLCLRASVRPGDTGLDTGMKYNFLRYPLHLYWIEDSLYQSLKQGSIPLGVNLAPNRPPKENMTSKVNFPPSPNNDPIAEKSKHDDPFSRITSRFGPILLALQHSEMSQVHGIFKSLFLWNDFQLLSFHIRPMHFFSLQ